MVKILTPLLQKFRAHLSVRAVLLLKRLGMTFLPKGRSYQRFIILCTARTGSTLLHTLLNSSLHIHSEGEVIESTSETKRFPLGTFAFKAYPRFIKAVGRKIFYDVSQYEAALQRMLEDQEVKIILLTRESFIEQFVSYQKALHTEQWSYKKTDNSKVHVDLEEFSNFKNNKKKHLTILKKKLKDREVFSLTYEKLVLNHEGLLLDLQAFLSVPPKRLVSVLKKQSNSPINEQIENWGEIKNQL